jgi:hypothetical protein
MFYYNNQQKTALRLLRNNKDVKIELDEIDSEMKINEDETNKNLSIIGLFRTKECRWPLIVSVTLQIAQQLSGINAVC